MATKDWKKLKNHDAWESTKKKTLVHVQTSKWWNVQAARSGRTYIVYIDGDKKMENKNKTKSLAFAKAYMRTH